MIFAKRPATIVMAFFAPEKSTCSIPGSPWIPSPSSAFPSGILLSFLFPGTVQESRDIPIEAVPLTTLVAASVIVSRVAPFSDKAPAILCTNKVPATPRACGRSGRAISSSTMTIFTFNPRARALSAAKPKLRRSPV